MLYLSDLMEVKNYPRKAGESL